MFQTGLPSRTGQKFKLVAGNLSEKAADSETLAKKFTAGDVKCVTHPRDCLLLGYTIQLVVRRACDWLGALSQVLCIRWAK